MSAKPHRLIYKLSLAQHRLLKSADTAFKDASGISTTQLGVLFFLRKNPGALLKDVSDALGVNASAITALIGRMEDAGLGAAAAVQRRSAGYSSLRDNQRSGQSGGGPADPGSLERSPHRRVQRARDCDGRALSRCDHRALLKPRRRRLRPAATAFAKRRGPRAISCA